MKREKTEIQSYPILIQPFSQPDPLVLEFSCKPSCESSFYAQSVFESFLSFERKLSEPVLTIANLITLARLFLVPLIVWALLVGQMMTAFLLFAIAGASDAIDGLIARNFDQQSELGTILDPLADKIMLVAVFLVLGSLGYVPLWLVIVIISRDCLIVLGIAVCFLLNRPVAIKPLTISKITTLAQICLVCFVLGALALELPASGESAGAAIFAQFKAVFEWGTAALTLCSAMAYLFAMRTHLASEAKPMQPKS